MEENLHNDKLERFFKENLERYSPSPSGDFWARMEAAIPPKPSNWQSFSSKYLKWVGLGLLLLSLATVFMLWRKDKQRIEQLSKQIAVAQQQVKDLVERQPSEFEPKEETQAATNSNSFEETTVEGLSAANDNSSETPKKVQTSQSSSTSQAVGMGVEAKLNPSVHNPPIEAAMQAVAKLAESPLAESLLIEKEEEKDIAVSKKETTQLTTSGINSLQTAPPTNLRLEEVKTPMLLPTAYALVSSNRTQAPAIRHQGIRPNRKPYPRISIEVGTAAFAMPLARLFNRDTNYTGAIRPSWVGSFALHYELSPSLALHGGYEFKNIRTSKMALRYNSVPILVSKKLRIGRRMQFEAKAGLTFNKFFNYRTYSDGISVRGRKDLWLGWQASAQFGMPISKDVLFLAGPYGGSGITPFANGKRTWETGLAANVRYQF